MGKLRWYRHDPNDALEGMAELTLEERGAYITVLDLIYTRDGALDDDLRFIAGWLRCNVRRWKRIRERLLILGKLYVNGNTLRNERADKEVADGLNRIKLAAQAGLKSAASRAEKEQILKGLPTASVQQPARQFVQLPKTTNTKNLSSNEGAADIAAYPGVPGSMPNSSERSEDLNKSEGIQGKRPSEVSRDELEEKFLQSRTTPAKGDS